MKKVVFSILKAALFIIVYFAIQVGVLLAVAIGELTAYMLSSGGNLEGSIEQVINDILLKNTNLVSILSSVICIVVFIIIYKLRKRPLLQELSLKPVKGSILLKVILLSLTLSLVITVAVSILYPYFPSYEEISSTIEYMQLSIWGIVATVIVAPIFEEIFLRGIIYNELRRGMAVIPAIILQGCIFGVIHGNLLQGLYASALGIILGTVYYWTGSLYTTIIMHMIFNLMGSLVLPSLDISDWALLVASVLSLVASVYLIIKLYRGRAKEAPVEGLEG